MLIVFLVITFIIAIALLLYFFLWKENYGEIRENMTDGGQGKGYDQKCNTDKKCKGNLTCTDIKQGKGTCKCKPGNIHFSELTDEQKKFFKGGVCIPKNALEDLSDKDGCEKIFNGVWYDKKCLPPGTKIASDKPSQPLETDKPSQPIKQTLTEKDIPPDSELLPYYCNDSKKCDDRCYNENSNCDEEYCNYSNTKNKITELIRLGHLPKKDKFSSAECTKYREFAKTQAVSKFLPKFGSCFENNNCNSERCVEVPYNSLFDDEKAIVDQRQGFIKYCSN